jgi:formylglycine-generating enzyme required for sulfatase activity
LLCIAACSSRIGPNTNQTTLPTGGGKQEQFEYYQEGQPGRGVSRVAGVQLGDNITMDLVLIPAGKFRMGSSPAEKERLPDENQHDVEISHDFYLGKYEVTRAQFREFVKETGYTTEAETDGQGGWGYDESAKRIEGRMPKFTWRYTGWAQTDQYPVVNVTWNDAEEFCHWLARKIGRPVRLPTEAEWEYAARAGASTPYYSGSDIDALVKVGNIADDAVRKQFPDWGGTIATTDGYVFTAPVGKFLANRFGIYDMQGNVWEWCEDWYGPYADLTIKDPLRADAVPDENGKTYRVMRGGGWGKRTPRIPTLSRRVGGAPGSRDLDLGFRVAIPLG